MSYKTSLLLPLAVLAAAILSPTAAASASSAPPWVVTPVSAGQVQHTVTETTFQSNETVPGETPWARIEDRWVSPNASRSVLSNANNGELLNEYASAPSSCTAYLAASNSQFSCHIVPADESWETAGAKIALLIARGDLRLTGSTTFLGRPANSYVSSAPGGELTVVADAASDYPLEEVVSFTYGAQTGEQISRVTTFETVSPTAAAQDLASASHPGATASRAHMPSTSKRKASRRHKRHGKSAEKSAARR